VWASTINSAARSSPGTKLLPTTYKGPGIVRGFFMLCYAKLDGFAGGFSGRGHIRSDDDSSAFERRHDHFDPRSGRPAGSAHGSVHLANQPLHDSATET
jgi:hypothetical protein